MAYREEWSSGLSSTPEGVRVQASNAHSTEISGWDTFSQKKQTYGARDAYLLLKQNICPVFFSYFTITETSHGLTPFFHIAITFLQTSTIISNSYKSIISQTLSSPSAVEKGWNIRPGDITEHRWPNLHISWGKGFWQLPEVLLVWTSTLPTRPSV